jgi:hypothetical protein
MALVLKYLNLSHHEQEKIGFNCNNINNYNNMFKIEPEEIKSILNEKIRNYIINKLEKITKNDCDANYYIENINKITKNKFKDIIKEIEIDYILMMIDYNNSCKNYKYYQNEYYIYFYERICNLEFTINNEKYKLYTIFDKLWDKINFKNIIEFSNLLNKFNYFGKDVSNFKNVIINKFDDDENITKLINYIINNFVLDEENEDNFENEDIKFNFRFIIDNLKSNGYILFEKYNILLKKRYSDKISITDIKKDIKIVKYFIYIVRNKDSNSVNKTVNDILIRMRDYLIDIEDSYVNNDSYKNLKNVDLTKKINFQIQYNNLDLQKLQRNIYQFKILKYNNVEEELVSDFKLSKELEPYFNNYYEYYNLKYEDREIEYDLINTTIIIQLKLNKTYQIHMALIQYLVLDVIYKKDANISLLDISKEINISLTNQKLENAINSLLKIKLIKKLSNSNEIILSMNKDFEMDNNKISINSLIIKEKSLNKEKEFLHDRQTIVYCNIIDYIKKNTILYEDTVINIIQYKIPFNITPNMISDALEQAVSNKHISKLEIENNKSSETQTIYKYIEP